MNAATERPIQRDADQPAIDPDTLSDEAFIAYRAGLRAGYAQGVAVLRDTAKALADWGPRRVVADAEARARRDRPRGPGIPPAVMHARAAASWGLPIPMDDDQPAAGFDGGSSR